MPKLNYKTLTLHEVLERGKKVELDKDGRPMNFTTIENEIKEHLLNELKKMSVRRCNSFHQTNRIFVLMSV